MINKILEKFFKAPAIILEKGVEKAEKFESELISKKPVRAAERYWETLGPGLTTGAADDDPSGIATYSQAGAKYGYGLLWLAPLTFPLMALVQEMCARIGLVTGRGLARNIKLHYSKSALYAVTGLLFFANTFNLGADLGIMAKGAQLVFPRANFAFLIITFTLTILLFQIFTTYARYARVMKYLALVLFSYVFSALLINLNWKEIGLSTIWPRIDFSYDQIFIICAILGTTISPYLFFWQSSQEVEDEILRGYGTVKQRQRNNTVAQIKKMRVDVWSGMFISNLAMFFIIVACAGTLFAAGIRDIASAEEAALALRPLAGNLAFFLFSLGIIGVGFLSIPVLAGSASYAISETFGWRTGLYRKLREAYSFYGVIIISMLLGLGMNFIGLDPVKTLIWAAVINGLVAPIVLYFVVSMSADKKIMGKFSSGKLTRMFGWMTIIIMAIAGLAVIVGSIL